ELERAGNQDVGSQAAIIVLNVGNAKIAIHEVRTRGNYLGSNLSYITKKLIEHGYLLREGSQEDLRKVNIALSTKGLRLSSHLRNVRERYLAVLSEVTGCDLERAIWTLRQVEELWIEQVLNGQGFRVDGGVESI